MKPYRWEHNEEIIGKGESKGENGEGTTYIADSGGTGA
jgi:hypothetical protein